MGVDWDKWVESLMEQPMIEGYVGGCVDYGGLYYDDEGNLHEVTGHKCSHGVIHDLGIVEVDRSENE